MSASKETVHREATNILLTGVGGQGVLAASETLALAALAEGLEAKQSEVHGVAQRGGSVVSHVRFGSRVYSPLIRCGEVDVLYAGEQLEALRNAHYLKPGGMLVMSDQTVKPVRYPGEAEMSYPQGVAEFLRGKGYSVIVVPALQTAVDLGDKRCASIVLLGALSGLLGLRPESWSTGIERRFPPALQDLNRQAFAAGQRFSTPDKVSSEAE
jgi:indolepyruvate ferredoxin oxidoreductase beta subunit